MSTRKPPLNSRCTLCPCEVLDKANAEWRPKLQVILMLIFTSRQPIQSFAFWSVGSENGESLVALVSNELVSGLCFQNRKHSYSTSWQSNTDSWELLAEITTWSNQEQAVQMLKLMLPAAISASQVCPLPSDQWVIRTTVWTLVRPVMMTWKHVNCVIKHTTPMTVQKGMQSNHAQDIFWNHFLAYGKRELRSCARKVNLNSNELPFFWSDAKWKFRLQILNIYLRWISQSSPEDVNDKITEEFLNMLRARLIQEEADILLQEVMTPRFKAKLDHMPTGKTLAKWLSKARNEPPAKGRKPEVELLLLMPEKGMDINLLKVRPCQDVRHCMHILVVYSHPLCCNCCCMQACMNSLRDWCLNLNSWRG